MTTSWKKQLPQISLVCLIVVAAVLDFKLRPASGSQEPEHVGQLISQLPADRVPASGGKKFTHKLPNIPVITHTGQQLSFYDDLIKDQSYCLAFFYVNCEGSCAGTISMMKALRRKLCEDFGSEMKFITITLDPETDRPESLKQYMAARKIEDAPGMPPWYFLTGTPEDIEELRKSFGLYDRDPVVDRDKSQHAALIIAGNDRTNRIASMPSGAQFDDLKNTISRIAGNTHRQRYAWSAARLNYIKPLTPVE